MALLNELNRSVLHRHLVRRGDVIEVRVLCYSVQPIVPHRTVRVANHALGVAAGGERVQLDKAWRVFITRDQIGLVTVSEAGVSAA